MMKKLLALALSLIMVTAVVAGCGNGGTEDTPAPTGSGDTPATSASGGDDATTPPATTDGGGSSSSVDNVLKLALATNPETCDPTMNSTVDGATYSVHRFEGLYRYKWDGSGVEPGLAESYEVSDDQLVWTFKLREGLKWSDGQPLTAGDFEYTLKRLVDPETAAPYGLDMGKYIKNATAILTEDDPMFGKVDELGVKAVDETTLEITLESPTSYFEEIVAFPAYYAVRQDVVESSDSWWSDADGLSSGPFKLVSFAMDDRMIMVPNENYWDAANVVPKTLEFYFMEPEAINNAVKAGEIDFGDQSLVEDVPTLTDMGIYDLRDQLGTYYISFNNQTEPFNDPNVRKAFWYAIDTKYISEVTLNGLYAPIDALVPSGFRDAADGSDFRSTGESYYNPEDYENNKKIAQEALAEAGYPNGEGFPNVEYMYNTTELHAAVAQVLQQQWKDVLGVDVSLSQQEWGTFTDTRRKGNFQIARNGWIADYNDPSTMLALFMSDSGNNDGKYSNTKFDDTMNAAFALPERNEEYFKLMHEAEDTLIGDYGCAPLFAYKDDMLVSTDLKDWGYSPLSFKFFQKATLATW